MTNVWVSIKPLTNINWLKQSTCSFKLEDTCNVWRIKISLKIAELDNLWLLLSLDERTRANRYHRKYDQHRFVISRAYLRILLGNYLNKAPAHISFEIGTNKKPFISGTNLQHNISHSGDYILIAISTSPVGVDVEKPDLLMLFDEVMDLSFSDKEVNFVKTSPDAKNAFYQIWTCKEALLKATAKGIDNDMSLIPGLIGEHAISPQIVGLESNWIVNTFVTDHEHIGSVATLNGKCSFWNVD